MTDIKLIYGPTGCSRVPHIALEEIGIPFTPQAQSVFDPAGRAELLKYNPVGQVPVLLVDGKPLTENVAILTWLHKTFPKAALLPPARDAFEEAQHLSKLAYCSSGLHPVVRHIAIPSSVNDNPDTFARTRELGIQLMRKRIQIVEDWLEVTPWILGDAWSIADAYYYWIFMRLTSLDVDLRDFPRYGDHYQRVKTRPSVQRVIAREKEVFEASMAKANTHMPSGVRVRFE